MELHELKLSLQRHLADGLVTIIGSGLSCAEGLPGMGRLADHLDISLPAILTGALADEWEALAPEIKRVGLEAAFLAKAPSPSLEVAIIATVGSHVADEEKKVVAELFQNGRRLRLTRLISHLIKPAGGIPLITTNYDRLVEIAVEEAGLGADTMFYGRFFGSIDEKRSRYSFCRDAALHRGKVSLSYLPRAAVFKPHGSLDWYLRGAKPVFFAGDLPGATRLIITPGQNKFRHGYQSPFDLHRAKANDAIDRASRFLIIGYGFNDDHLETHLVPAIEAGKPALLITQKLSDAAQRLVSRCSSVIALEALDPDGTRAHVATKPYDFAGVRMWDLNDFISEILEP